MNKITLDRFFELEEKSKEDLADTIIKEMGEVFGGEETIDLNVFANQTLPQLILTATRNYQDTTHEFIFRVLRELDLTDETDKPDQ